VFEAAIAWHGFAAHAFFGMIVLIGHGEGWIER
jgi:hypothetical protein